MTLNDSALWWNEMFVSFCSAGFAPDQALYLTGEAMKAQIYVAAGMSHG